MLLLVASFIAIIIQMPINPTFWKADSITGASNNNLARMPKKMNDTGITF